MKKEVLEIPFSHFQPYSVVVYDSVRVRRRSSHKAANPLRERSRITLLAPQTIATLKPNKLVCDSDRPDDQLKDILI